MMSNRRFAAALALGSFAAHAAPAAAQREIVQPLPAPGERRLSEALAQLARNSLDVSALLDAGEATLELGDIDAATGFFGRANELSPGHARAKLGLARAYTRSRRPVEALRLFAEAEQAGVPLAQMAGERGLAFDLVGDSASAQQLYRLAIANGAGEEAVRRLALSQAIAGDRKGFEASLLPLLEKGDVAAFRARAFGLAILGDARAAKDIANTMLPAGVGTRMAAYFDYMPRLTKAQQAAAANLGVFPRTAAIGTDEAGIAEYAGPAVRIAQADPAPARPATAKVGLAADPRGFQTRNAVDRSASGDIAGAPVRAPAPAAAQTAPVAALSRTPAPTPPPTPTPTPAVASSPAPPPVAVAAAAASRPSIAQVDARNSVAAPVVVARAAEAATAPAEAAMPPPASSPPPPPPAPEPQAEPEPASVADAFGDFALDPQVPAPAASGAVDITRIAIPRERAEPKPPPPPAHPSRHWVQVATGKDIKALGFDWRRIARKASGKLDGKGPFVTPWVEANRLLAGPYDSAEAARDMVKELKKLGVDSFTFTSAEGEKIDKLP